MITLNLSSTSTRSGRKTMSRGQRDTHPQNPLDPSIPQLSLMEIKMWDTQLPILHVWWTPSLCATSAQKGGKRTKRSPKAHSKPGPELPSAWCLGPPGGSLESWAEPAGGPTSPSDGTQPLPLQRDHGHEVQEPRLPLTLNVQHNGSVSDATMPAAASRPPWWTTRLPDPRVSAEPPPPGCHQDVFNGICSTCFVLTAAEAAPNLSSSGSLSCHQRPSLTLTAGPEPVPTRLPQSRARGAPFWSPLPGHKDPGQEGDQQVQESGLHVLWDPREQRLCTLCFIEYKRK